MIAAKTLAKEELATKDREGIIDARKIIAGSGLTGQTMFLDQLP
jgi:hypothetical protein